MSHSDFVKLRQLMKEGCSRHELQVHAYVLMNNHFHLLATPSERSALSEAIKWVAGAYTQWFNHKYGTSGTLWEGRFWAAQVDSEEYFLCCSSYVELNPTRAGIVTRPGDYPWSSYRCSALGVADPLITPHDTYLRLGITGDERTLSYRRLLQAGLDGDTESFIREATRAACSIGTCDFLKWRARRPVECAN